MKKLGDEVLEDITYPAEAIHEIMSNAVLHRDYSFADDIHVRVYDNRVEVESPGRLPAYIMPKNILDERFARNPSIVRLINKFPDPPNEDVGEAPLNPAFSAMKKLGLKEPLIDNKENSVLVVLRHESLASPEVIILDCLKSNHSIQNKKAREICNVNEDYVVEIFRRLSDRGLIEKRPGTRTSSTAYKRGVNFVD